MGVGIFVFGPCFVVWFLVSFLVKIAIILLRKRDLVALLNCAVATFVMCLFLNIYKHSVFFVGYRQTVQNQTRRHKARRLIRFSTVFLQTYLLTLNKNE